MRPPAAVHAVAVSERDPEPGGEEKPPQGHAPEVHLRTMRTLGGSRLPNALPRHAKATDDISLAKRRRPGKQRGPPHASNERLPVQDRSVSQSAHGKDSHL